MSAVSVRQAVLSDLDELARLFGEYRAFQGKSPEPERELAFLRARFDHGESVVFLASDAASPVGFGQLYPIYSSVSLARVFVLNDLFVRQAGRRKGVASRLLAEIEAYAWAMGAARITLNVARDNLPGQELYEARGWTQDDQFFMYHRFAQDTFGPAGSPSQSR